MNLSAPRVAGKASQGLILTYGFNHAKAARSFREAARLDPNCAMARWGAAFVLGSNINASMNEESIPKAYSELQKALELATEASEKEQALIQALSKRYSPEPVGDRTPLEVAYADVMCERRPALSRRCRCGHAFCRGTHESQSVELLNEGWSTAAGDAGNCEYIGIGPQTKSQSPGREPFIHSRCRGLTRSRTRTTERRSPARSCSGPRTHGSYALAHLYKNRTVS